MGIADTLNFEKVPGKTQTHQLRVYALSTCGFCEKALAFLKQETFAHEYLYIDQIDPELKRALKTELKERFGNIPVFPVLVVDDKECISGFTEEKWKTALGIA